MSGYSQGGQVVHNAAKLMPSSAMSALSSIVIFGDPGKLTEGFLVHEEYQLANCDQKDEGYPIQGADASKVLTICHAADNICAHGDWIHVPHLTYLIDAPAAADFVMDRI